MNYKNFNIPNLVNLKQMMQKALKGKYCIVQINLNNLEWAKAALFAAEELQSPVIVAFSEGAIKYIGGTITCARIVVSLIKDLKITVPVVIHLDHGPTLELCEKAADSGFSSIMYDGSHYDIKKNCAESKKARGIADKHDLSLEVEVGTVGVSEDATEIDHGITYAKVEDCQTIVKIAKPDVLAAALGSVHGHYHAKPNLNFKRMKIISNLLKIPLVLHGTSGIPKEQIAKAIQNGTTKMNVNTQFQEEFFNATKDYIMKKDYEKISKGFDPRKLLKPGYEAMFKSMKQYIEFAGGKGETK